MEKARACFDYDPHYNHEEAMRHNEENVVLAHLKEAKQNLEQENQKLREIVQYHSSSHVNFGVKSELAIDMWRAPYNLKSCVVLINPMSQILGCNGIFRRMAGISDKQRSGTIENIFPPGEREAWPAVLKLFFGMKINFLQAYTILSLNGVTCSAKFTFNFHDNFCITSIEVMDMYADEFRIDNFVLEPTFVIRDPVQLSQLKRTPTADFNRFEALLWEICKANYRKPVQGMSLNESASLLEDAAINYATLPPQEVSELAQLNKSLSPTPISVKFPPVQLNFEELTQVATRMQTQPNS
jgi:hypothetical protein